MTRSSSDWVQTADGAWIKARVPQTRGLSLQHNHFLKSIFKGAATTVITQRNKDPIYRRYERLIDGGMGDAMRRLTSPAALAREIQPSEGEFGANDRSHSASDVERRKGVRPRTSQSDCKGTRRLSRSSIRRIEEEAIVTACNREQSSQTTHCVVAEVSIHEIPRPQHAAWRHQG